MTTIDATNKILGRLASEIALLLRGKNQANFVPYRIMGEVVKVVNVDKMKFTGKKLKQKEYYHYSGYPGGLKSTTLEKMFKSNPGQVLKKAVWGMLPKNKLRKEMMKRLIIKN